MTENPAPELPIPAGRITILQLAAVVGVATVLAVAQDIFVPLAIAMLITFALAPVVTFLRRQGLPLLVTVLAVVSLAFALIGAVALVFGVELGSLAQNLPAFQANILAKVQALKAAGGGSSLVAQLSDMISAINAQIGAALPASGTAPMAVEVVQPTNALDVVQGLVLPLIGPAASTGLVIVLVIFMLLERETLRDRFIRLVGSNDLHRTTQVLQEAGSRVATYLLIQLLVNTVYALPIGLGLWLIGVPNAALWGLLTLILRFVPFIGSALAAAFPLFLAFAVSPDWSAVLWTLALFGAVELITSNVVEPWLYGSRTGLSPLAIIVAALVWTFLWGPLGLVLSTPLTVCLVVLGRHVPQFGLFDILLGDEPMLAPHARLYQRLLVGDALEASFSAEEALETMALADYHQDILIPALLLAQDDLDRGVLTTAQEERLALVASAMAAELTEETTAPTGPVVAVVGGRSAIDDVAALILAQNLTAEGAVAQARGHLDLAPSRLALLDLPGCACLILTFLDRNATRASLLHLRRLKRAAPGLRVGVVILQMPQGLHDAESGLRHFPPVPAAKLDEALDLGADFAVTTLESATQAAFDQSPAKPVPPRVAPRPRRLIPGETR
ncbi:AI-2E family transporter [Rhodobacter sp. KR11]|uniref:AI-2E family transporter n=1 Tax=Rhodobacter sp. KR11 TaxID=2974588 RepID=UPI002222F4D0|nr:AI-2E family transporter [Rhodobacter sp. KR11]MCW1919763.1 AI-2E family transporter [Rhodobacter sp. KR11]